MQIYYTKSNFLYGRLTYGLFLKMINTFPRPPTIQKLSIPNTNAAILRIWIHVPTVNMEKVGFMTYTLASLLKSHDYVNLYIRSMDWLKLNYTGHVRDN